MATIKRSLFFAITMTCFALLGLTVFAENENLIQNISFESEIFPATTYGGSTLSISSEYFFKHCHSLKVTQTENYGAAKLPVELEGGRTYSYSAWVRFDPASPAEQSICLAYIGSNGEVEKLLSATPKRNRFDDWVNITGIFQLQEEREEEFISIYANPSSDGLQTFYVDWVELKEINAPKVIGFSIQNGSAGVSPVDLKVEVEFDREMDSSTLIGFDSLVAMVEEYNNEALPVTKCTLIIKRNMLYANQTHTICIGSTVKSLDGESLADTWITFTVGYPNFIDNQITNSGFENTDTVTLESEYIPRNTMLSSETDLQNVYKGSAALKVEQTQKYGNVSQRVYLQNGKKYYVSVYAKLVNATQATRVNLNMIYESSNHIFVFGDAKTSADGYFCVSGIFYAPDNANLSDVYLSVYADPSNDQPITFFLDNLEMYGVNSFAPVGTISVYKDYNSSNQIELTKLQSGNITVVLEGLKNISQDAKEVVLIAALYDGKILTDIKTSSIMLNSGVSLYQPLTASINPLDIDKGNYCLKIYVWEGMDEIEPITKGLRFTE